MYENYHTGVADIVEMIHQSRQSTSIGIADEVLQSCARRKIIEAHLADQSIELPVISFSFQKRGYVITLSPTNEDQQLSQICMLLSIVGEEIDLDKYSEFTSYKECFEANPDFEESFNTIKNAMTAKALPIS